MGVSARVAQAYAKSTPNTLSRDLNTLLEMHLVEHSGSEWRAKTEVIQAFLPFRAERFTGESGKGRSPEPSLRGHAK